MNSQTVNLIKHSETKLQAGCYPSRIILWLRDSDKTFITHIEVMPPDRDSYLILGHYDMTLTDALYDYEKRCKSLEVIS